MTKKFEEKDWQQAGNGFIYELEGEVTDDKPLVQVYRVTEGVAMIDSTAVVVITNIVTIASPVVFNGYVVIVR